MGAIQAGPACSSGACPRLNGEPEHVPLITSFSNVNHVWMEISTASELMRVEGKTLEELQDQIAPKTFHILEVYLRSDCPRESLLRLYALYLYNNADRAYLTSIARLLNCAEQFALQVKN